MIMQNTVFLYEDVCGEEEDCVRITGAQHIGGVLQIPERLDEKTVTSIGKKAFWGCDGVREIVLPVSIREIEDWAFASCKQLETVSMPHRQVGIGRGVFRGCERLTCIGIREPLLADEEQGVGHLLAAGDRLLNNPYLLDIASAGTDEWYARWDAALEKLMETAEDEGFSKMLLCGEEDYGSRENNIDHYCSQQRKKKARAALLRLRYDDWLGSRLRGELTAFLTAHTMGCKTKEAWEVLTAEHGEDRSYYELFEAAGGIHEHNREQCIADLGEAHTEMKAYLLGKTTKAEDDFFDLLTL
ncbi:MAG: leucine-rich repeat domain-containing protein [Lachnospiraceae bacterium]|nr:leucine-rich repeat domain-containing protein [Lachnospiraceae bacterium]